MRIHCGNEVTTAEVYAAARFARVAVVTEDKLERGSRSRAHAFEVKLEGESRRRPNGGSSGKGYASGYAATWDQWGVFLSVLFDFDPDAKCWAYDGRDDFHRKTGDRFRPGGIVSVGPSTNANAINVRQWDGPDDTVTVYRTAGSYWPSDAHGDHRFDYAGTPRTFECKKCSARMTYA